MQFNQYFVPKKKCHACPKEIVILQIHILNHICQRIFPYKPTNMQ